MSVSDLSEAESELVFERTSPSSKTLLLENKEERFTKVSQSESQEECGCSCDSAVLVSPIMSICEHSLALESRYMRNQGREHGIKIVENPGSGMKKPQLINMILNITQRQGTTQRLLSHLYTKNLLPDAEECPIDREEVREQCRRLLIVTITAFMNPNLERSTVIKRRMGMATKALRDKVGFERSVNFSNSKMMLVLIYEAFIKSRYHSVREIWILDLVVLFIHLKLFARQFDKRSISKIELGAHGRALIVESMIQPIQEAFGKDVWLEFFLGFYETPIYENRGMGNCKLSKDDHGEYFLLIALGLVRVEDLLHWQTRQLIQQSKFSKIKSIYGKFLASNMHLDFDTVPASSYFSEPQGAVANRLMEYLLDENCIADINEMFRVLPMLPDELETFARILSRTSGIIQAQSAERVRIPKNFLVKYLTVFLDASVFSFNFFLIMANSLIPAFTSKETSNLSLAFTMKRYFSTLAEYFCRTFIDVPISEERYELWYEPIIWTLCLQNKNIPNRNIMLSIVNHPVYKIGPSWCCRKKFRGRTSIRESTITCFQVCERLFNLNPNFFNSSLALGENSCSHFHSFRRLNEHDPWS
ncbi:Oidioi.mRNA.OKI2018_I69.chr2.g6334.t1.cds [Oikopleura dioica]|uniref:Oidioi.mRNA.OKI2018_I69.chr2.g6334.t1.cds n=1 Tax=Oikopleura dioica TaxID=34765 RepID=A0ABN7T6I6_OIKDI|nr:Oidioi.mRNA.OKI2018_I69.chr2.g6334.t1.cds [Oikopleura dioica]